MGPFFSPVPCLVLFFVILILFNFFKNNKNAVTAAFSLACLEIRLRNEEAINSIRNVIYLLKVFLLPALSTLILFICFLIDLVRVLATTRNTSAIANQTNHTLFQTKMAKNPYPLAPHIPL